MVAGDFGNNMGLLGGDSTIYMGLEAFLLNNFDTELNLKAIEYYEEASHQFNEGMLNEIDMINRNYLTISEYLEMISFKTGAMVEKAMLIGANYANVAEKNKRLISTFGTNLGILLQIIEDLSGMYLEKPGISSLINGYVRKSRISQLLIEVCNNLEVEDVSSLIKIINSSDMEFEIDQKTLNKYPEKDMLRSNKVLIGFYQEKVRDAFNNLKLLMNKEGLEFFEDILSFSCKSLFLQN